jgi:hypothetical protein
MVVGFTTMDRRSHDHMVVGYAEILGYFYHSLIIKVYCT